MAVAKKAGSVRASQQKPTRKKLTRAKAFVGVTKAGRKAAGPAVSRKSAGSITKIKLGSAKALVSTQILLKAYGKAVQKSRDVGQPLQLTVEVNPEGNAKIVGVTAIPRSKIENKAGDPALAEALDAARARGEIRVSEILSGADMLSADAFAQRLGTTRATVNTWRQKHQLLALEGATRGFRFPVWQVGSDGKPFTVLPALFAVFSNSAWAVYRFLVQHHPELDGLTGREALLHRETEEVLAAAESVAQAFG